jgi:ZIP family zinc transporter
MTHSVAFALLLALLAGLSTAIGSVLAYFMHQPRPQYMSLVLGFSGGVMIYVAFAELLHSAFENIGFGAANIGFFAGIAFIMLIDLFIPHEYKHEDSDHSFSSLIRKRGHRPGIVTSFESSGVTRRSRLMRASMLMAIGIAIHNFPEGLVTFSSALTGDRAFGILVAVAIAIHNIPEGISVSIPIVQATGSRKRAFIYSFLAGLAEPVGALIGYAVLFNFLTPTVIYVLMAFAAGIMVYITLDEILPTAHMFGQEHLVIIGAAGGMALMALSIFLIL